MLYSTLVLSVNISTDTDTDLYTVFSLIKFIPQTVKNTKLYNDKTTTKRCKADTYSMILFDTTAFCTDTDNDSSL